MLVCSSSHTNCCSSTRGHRWASFVYGLSNTGLYTCRFLATFLSMDLRDISPTMAHVPPMQEEICKALVIGICVRSTGCIAMPSAVEKSLSGNCPVRTHFACYPASSVFHSWSHLKTALCLRHTRYRSRFGRNVETVLHDNA